MALYMALDGGGSKLIALLFDDDLHVLGTGKGDSVNTNFISMEVATANVDHCIAQCLQGRDHPAIDTVYYTFLGPEKLLPERLSLIADVHRWCELIEGPAGLLAGSMKQDGIVAVSGTGSDVFYIRQGITHGVVGGWGSLLGDDGSGYWIGTMALRAAIRAHDGWERPTLLVDMLKDAWGLDKLWDMVPLIYHHPAQSRQMASTVPIAARAAAMGDTIALDIFREAGRLLAKQTVALVTRYSIPAEHRNLVVCGGAWKGCPAMLDAFRAYLADAIPDLTLSKPRYEHVMAGVVCHLLERGNGVIDPALQQIVDDQFALWRATW